MSPSQVSTSPSSASRPCLLSLQALKDAFTYLFPEILECLVFTPNIWLHAGSLGT